ncbi:putative serine/threonine protein kinase KSP1 [Saccharomyces paradoxus]|uniref:non-specific serine/threonine protein kinase n=1 Tax=Saccharomyces paradoxus TaxID=27291 RepID=A0A8B8USP3_SACPA|nr:Ksp1 [Saccharomyces paradoxus]QHS73721.1 Ksp1 [Saccharomyces paradoxus]
MTLDYEIYKEGGILNNRYQKIEDISEGSYGYVSLAKDVREKRLVAVKYIFKLEDDGQFDNPEDDNNDCSDGDCDDDEETKVDTDCHENEDGNATSNNGSSREKKHNLYKHKKSLISSKVKSRLSNNICLEAMYEVDIQTKIGRHENIAALLDFFDSYIIMEYCSGGDLYEAIKADAVPKKTKSITHIITQIMDAIEYVHNKGIYHRDIKPENILISGIDWTIKLTDWGLATTDKTSMDRNVGSERYMSPELFDSNLDINERKEPYDCAKVDLWAMGIVFLNIVFHKNPFSIANQSDKSFCYFAANREALFDVFSTMAYDFFQVLRYSLTIDPANRDLNMMRTELQNLSEYTLDDEYYNNLDEGYEETMVDGLPPQPVPPSSAPVSLPTPISSSSKQHMTEFKKDFNFNNVNERKRSDVSQNQNVGNGFFKKPSTQQQKFFSQGYNNTTLSPHERAKSAPKFKFKKRNKYGKTDNQHPKPVNIEDRKKSKILKKSRKPLGIPTPNTHMNNFFHDYKAKDEFNTRDFFTPPSVQHRYMEGFSNNNNKQYRQNRNYNNNNNNHGNNYNNFNNGNSYIKGWNKNFNKYRRPSSSSYSGKSPLSRYSMSYNHNNNSSVNGYARRGSTTTVQHSPGAYIPPNARNHHVSPTNQFLRVPQSTAPDISTVLGSKPSYQEHYNQDIMDSEGDHDSDDVLFTLEEGDHDFVNGINNLSINDQLPHATASSHNEVYSHANNNHSSSGSNNNHDIGTTSNTNQYHRQYIPPPLATSLHINNNNNESNELPDLLKSPASSEAHLNLSSGPIDPILTGNIDNRFSRSSDSKEEEQERRLSMEQKFKNGVYVPPHHRKSFNLGTQIPPVNMKTSNEATLSVSHNSVNFGGSYNSRRSSVNESNPLHMNKALEKSPASPGAKSSFVGFPKPLLPRNHSSTTIALQNEDVFADSNNDAIIFEDEEYEGESDKMAHGKMEGEDNESSSTSPDERQIFGPYEIYAQTFAGPTHGKKLGAGRKSSIQDEMVGSLEQYKNNWLILQQQD